MYYQELIIIYYELLVLYTVIQLLHDVIIFYFCLVVSLHLLCFRGC